MDTLGSQLATQLGSGAVGGDVDLRPDRPAPRAGRGRERPARVGRRVGAREPGRRRAADVAPRRGACPVVLLVLGRHTDPTILSGVVSGLAAKATGLVVVGTSGSATTSGDLRGAAR